MFKSLLLALSILLTVSILGPSVITLLDCNDNMVLTLESEDENKNEKKKDTEEKEFFYYSLGDANNMLVSSPSTLIPMHLEFAYDFTREILLPPPEYAALI